MTRRRLIAPALLAPVAGLVTAPDARAARATRPGRRPHRILIFTRTSGFRHSSIPLAIRAATELGQEHGFEIMATEDPTVFTDAELRGYTALLFANTTGNILTDRGRRAIKRFVTSGGGWAGVHSAADTEYDWPFYTELLSGARFLCHPLIPQSATVLRESADHLSTRRFPPSWQTPVEEFYSFTDSPRGRAKILLAIDEGSYLQVPNTSMLPTGASVPPVVTGTMGDHPMCWQRPIGRGLSWYTALGHEVTMYENPTFRRHLLGGLLTVTRHGRRHLPTA
ncbi:ThuA domain-containing protein [Nocardioides sp. R-C-SC26]|uniref:ThuA domain-containing protein n=1 Tax=Nocardioides sp. R-C-SC26 TaxID=2870414 RepID=UPI001E55217D|nr:ThuA domain-containing protein [Nocardioides sp. R-C-SC26]